MWSCCKWCNASGEAVACGSTSGGAVASSVALCGAVAGGARI